MNSRIIWLWIASVLSALLTGVAGKECTSEDNSYTISSPEDVIKYFDGCTTINSDRIIIRNTYEGPFVLPTVTKITGTIRCEYNSGMTRPAVIPALEAPDLLYLGALEIQEADSLTNISFPQLETVAGGISIGSTAEYVHTSFPALTESGSLSIRARFSNLNFPSLTKVRNDLTVDFCPSCPPPFAKRSVSFPSLQSAGYVRLVGAITSSVPCFSSMAYTHIQVALTCRCLLLSGHQLAEMDAQRIPASRFICTRKILAEPSLYRN
ncbi:hypothetical protein BDW59DRAFT_145106 [Aspergillus cavernicola]|uniref:Uncharacterized protein n=1 Tax=Aspergillus cavernicola TaxID=176166 RepID=A0ABR4IG47_9EURO